ncbi:hypothetical protein FRC96_03205 [Lujinxingia vulgaris]|uniref:Right handed beta helix domain-containing protein n=1 Tax=Lujinxingia vulgaris TaxID=2600176 RepID=A0A5C6XID7_9DELT|nr:right-handed parallel beta-helix repeat-containing protein [Lujinxingia vulgaris]TXD42688.1 hypothetical protein FRC96_03205 [Lujinxingia vulgaris]
MFPKIPLAILTLLLSLSIACGDDPIGRPDSDTDTDIETDTGDTDPDTDPDPDTPRLIIPGSLELSAALGASATTTFVVQNAGLADLELELESQDAWLTPSLDQLTLSPDAQESIMVTATCADENLVRSTDLFVRSNDPRALETTVAVTLVCGDAELLSDLNIEVEGLPEGLAADVTVSGPESFEATLTGSDEFTDLTPGTYTLSAARVGDDLLYDPSQASQTLELIGGRTKTAIVNYALVPGSLQVSVTGLPAGETPTIEFVDADQNSTSVPADGLLEGLTPGDYQLIPADLIVGTTTYSASTATVTILSAIRSEATIAYADVVELGSMQIAATGLPAGAAFTTRIQGEGLDTYVVGAQTVENLATGEYTLTFQDFSADGVIYSAPPVDVSVTTGDPAVATAAYSAGDTTLIVHVSTSLPMDLDFEILSGGNVVQTFSTSDDTTETLLLNPGSYTIELASYPQVADDVGNVTQFAGLGDSFTLIAGATVERNVSVTIPTVVTQGGDNGPGSLRGVVASVNEGSTIRFAPDVQEVALTSRVLINKPLHLLGDGQPGDLVIRGAGDHGLFEVLPNMDVTFENLTLRDGHAEFGGAIYSQGKLTLRRVDLRSNHATDQGGAVWQDERPVDFFFVRALDNSSDGDGGAVYVARIFVHIRDCLFEGNNAVGKGGALFAFEIYEGYNAVLQRNLFNENTAAQGGAIYAGIYGYFQNNTFTANNATLRGGAFYHHSGDDLVLTHNTFTANGSPEGAAIWKYQNAALTLDRNLIASNATGGGALYTPLGSGGSLFTSSGYNVLGDVNVNIVTTQPTDIVGDATYNAHLLPLADNGGFTQSVAVGSASDAYQAVPKALCMDAIGVEPLGYDQRMAPRSSGAFCTVGAWEVGSTRSGTFEDFEAMDFFDDGYGDHTFYGREGFPFRFLEGRKQGDYPIEGQGLLLRDATSRLGAIIPGGLSSISLQFRKAFTGGADRSIEIRINGQVVATSQVIGPPAQSEDATVYTVEANGLNIAGPFALEIRNLGAQVVIDNLVWD